MGTSRAGEGEQGMPPRVGAGMLEGLTLKRQHLAGAQRRGGKRTSKSLKFREKEFSQWACECHGSEVPENRGGPRGGAKGQQGRRQGRVPERE